MTPGGKVDTKAVHFHRFRSLRNSYRGRLALCSLITALFVLSIIVSVFGFFIAVDAGSWIFAGVSIITFLGPILLFAKVRNLYHSRRRAISLLDEFTSAYFSCLNANVPEGEKLESLRRLESVFISHNDDLALKKSIWLIIEHYVADADNFLAFNGYNPSELSFRNEWEISNIDNYKITLTNRVASAIAKDTQQLWQKHDALRITPLADRFTYPIYFLKRELRKLNFWRR